MSRQTRVVTIAVGVALALGFPGVRPSTAQSPTILYSLFERYLDPLRQQAGIPGLSALIIRNGEVEWERGFGVQDIEGNVPATPDTPYPVGGLTQTLSTVILGLCAEEGRLAIDDPVRRWVPDFPAPGATVRLLLAHATEGAPAFRFQYDEARFASLTTVGQLCADESFRVNVAESVLNRLGMAASVPGADLLEPDAVDRPLFDAATLDRYAAVVDRMARPYRVDRSGRATLSDWQSRGFTAANGLVSTARDLARFDAALDDAVLLRPQTLGVAWHPVRVGSETMPTGLGWFVQAYGDDRLIWHFSLIPDGYSALILKMPARRTTLILLANSDGLSTGANLERGDVTASPFVRIFLRVFG